MTKRRYGSKKTIVNDGSDEMIGARIYMEALSGRRGFRDDQLGIFDQEIWDDIFRDIGKEARIIWTRGAND